MRSILSESVDPAFNLSQKSVSTLFSHHRCHLGSSPKRFRVCACCHRVLHDRPISFPNL